MDFATLTANRRCPYGGGCATCPCKGECPYHKPPRKLAAQLRETVGALGLADLAQALVAGSFTFAIFVNLVAIFGAR
jgi:hypothetical protein